MTEKPHIAGKERNDVLAHSIYEQWKNYGFDSVEMSNYSVLLDYVDRSNYNKLALQDSSGQDLFVANTTVEKPLVEVEEDPNVPPPFNAYSGVGQAKVSHELFLSAYFITLAINQLMYFSGTFGICELWKS